MTIHVHKNCSSINAGGSCITRVDNGIPELETDRTWAFDAPPSVEERVLDDVELTARTSGAVPKTYDETLEEQAAARHSAKDVSDMATALKDLVNEGRRREAPASV